MDIRYIGNLIWTSKCEDLNTILVTIENAKCATEVPIGFISIIIITWPYAHFQELQIHDSKGDY